MGAFIISLSIFKLGPCEVRNMFKNAKCSKKPSLVCSVHSFFTSTIRLGLTMCRCVFICALTVSEKGLDLS